MCIGMRTILLQEYDNNQHIERSRFMNKYRIPNNQNKQMEKQKITHTIFGILFSLFSFSFP